MNQNTFFGRYESIIVYLIVLSGILAFSYYFVVFENGGIGPIIAAYHLDILFQLFLTLILIKSYFFNKYMFSSSLYKIEASYLFSIFFILYIIFSFETYSIYGLLFQFVFLLFISLLLRLNSNIQVRIVDVFVKILSIILLLSIIEYIVSLLSR